MLIKLPCYFFFIYKLHDLKLETMVVLYTFNLVLNSHKLKLQNAYA